MSCFWYLRPINGILLRVRLEEKVVYQGRRMGIRDSLGVWDQHVHIVIMKMNNPQGPTI